MTPEDRIAGSIAKLSLTVSIGFMAISDLEGDKNPSPPAPYPSDKQVERLAGWLKGHFGHPSNSVSFWASDARAALLAAGQPDEGGWLIEITGPKWFSAGPQWNWTQDAIAALRFARREDAENFGKWSTLDIATGETLKYTEHSWPLPAPPTPTRGG